MPTRRPLAIVLLASTACLALGFAATPFWDEDEPRFAAIAQTMVSTGDWIVPIYNGTLAVDKPVLMHWCMAAAFTLFGTTEIPARLPAALATLATALALLRAGTRWFDQTTGVVAALAFVGCLLVGIESHAATPDSILVALTTWSTVLAAEWILPDRRRHQSGHPAQPEGWPDRGRLGVGRAALVGGLTGLAVLCKGPIGFVGPLAVLVPWAWLVAVGRLSRSSSAGAAPVPPARIAALALLDTAGRLRLGVMTAAMLAVAGPWYLAVSLRTGGAWPAGFFLVHNVGRFVAPMEKHGGSLLFHPLGMLVGFYPWSCFLPLAVAVAAWRVWKRAEPPAATATSLLLLGWLGVWIGGFSAAATKLPNYVLPAYPAAALLVAAMGVAAARQPHWRHPRWMAAGLWSLAAGGLAAAATVLVAGSYGLAGAEPAALVGAVPILGAASILWCGRRDALRAVTAMTITGLAFTALAVGPAARRIAMANTLPALVGQAHAHAGGRARLGTYTQNTPNIVFYSRGTVGEWTAGHSAEAIGFLGSGADAVLVVPEPRFADLSGGLPEGVGIVGRTRPLFAKHDFLLVGTQHRGMVQSPARSGTTAERAPGSITR
ncbi:MAG: phospholipid carrier-dependent glycosyltransferase [Planctomycetia bacterium]|nr:phospholipid carrier-dependent glycosyltransferase [Planctomycetia bacterium]